MYSAIQPLNNRGLEAKCVPEMLQGSLLKTRRSAIGRFFFFRLLVTVPEDFAKINPAQLTSRLGPMSLFEGENLTYFSTQPRNSH